LAPDQAGSSGLEAVQLVALSLPHVSSLDPSSAIDSMLATREAATAAPTVTVALAGGTLVAPPAPVQVSV
jgi:hypothetical protein